jgi:hypothetical protein
MSFRRLLRTAAFTLLLLVQAIHAGTPLWTGESFMDSVKGTGADKLHAVGITGKGVSVAVLDTIYSTTNSYIRDNIIADASYSVSRVGTQITPAGEDDIYYSRYSGHMTDYLGSRYGYDFYGGKGVSGLELSRTIEIPVSMDQDDYVNRWLKHGTASASTVVGMAPDAGLVLLGGISHATNDSGENWIDMLYPDTIDLLMHYAAGIADEHNIVAFNGSMSYNAYFKANQTAEAAASYPALAEALNALHDANILPVFSSGNEGANNFLPVPPAMEDAVAVGAYGPDGTISEFTNLNKKVVLIAPGQLVLAAAPEWINDGEELFEFGGTSAAAPHVSGAVALLASGARNASIDEIYKALIDSADTITTEGMIEALRQEYRRMAYDDEDGNLPQGAQAALEQNEYRLLRVDKAYALLTSNRTRSIYEKVRNMGSPYADMIRAFASELGSDVDDSAAVFQLLEMLSLQDQVRVAREMSPAILAAGSETLHIATSDLHGALGRRMYGNRLNYEMQPDPCETIGYPRPMPNSREWIERVPGESFTIWAEGSGGWMSRGSGKWDREYDAHNGGVTVGGEAYLGDWTAGLFANVSHHEINGGGNIRSDVGAFGLYGSLNQGNWYLDGSVGLGWGMHDSERQIYLPSAVFVGINGVPIFYDSISRTAEGHTRSLNFSGRFAAGAMLFDWGSWRMNAEADLSASYLGFDGYREKKAASLDLHLDPYNSTYLDAGITLGLTHMLRQGERPLFATFKIGGRYGKMFDNGLSGAFRAHESSFSVDPDLIATFWATPELSLNWQVTDRTFLYASYMGRFGENRSGHTGRVGVEVAW